MAASQSFRPRTSVLMYGSLAVAIFATGVAGALSMRGTSPAAADSPAVSVTFDAATPPAQDPPTLTFASERAAVVKQPINFAPTATSPTAVAVMRESLAASTPTPSTPAAQTPIQAKVVATLAATPRPVLDEMLTSPASAASSVAPVLEREHKVQPGETLSAIAQRYGLRTDTLVANNAGVTDRDMLKIGQSLRVPPRDGVLYAVRLGDSLAAIANRYSITPATVLAEPVNHLSTADLLREGQIVFLPGAVQPAAAPAIITPTRTPAPPTPVVTARPATASAVPATIVAATARAATTVATTVSTGWRWPVTGVISSYFGPSHPLGIDIDLIGREGTPIGAARSGVVTFAGGNPCCSYGYYVEIDHGDGYSAIYAHFNAPPPVHIGQRVAQGETIGYGGSTGYSTGTHLHFEIRRNGVPGNPLGYLP